MKNLKRVLSLALTGVMLVGMMAIGASAADTKDFTDKDEIVHTEAVDVMSTLGVLKGKDTGAFDPKATVTRAEMAKIITVMLNGGVDPTLGSGTASKFTDTANHWAKNYIEYCANLGVIAGQGDGTFAPDAPVTGAAAAKMLLVALGYDSAISGFTGADWDLNVNQIANTEAKLYDEIKGIDTSAGLSRDDTAQMAYNALEAYVMERTDHRVVGTGEVSYTFELSTDTTFLNKYFDAYTFIGQMTGNSDTEKSNVKGHIYVNGRLDTTPEFDAAGNPNNKDANFPSTMDISNIGEEVKVIFKDGKGGQGGRPDKNDTIYGVFNTGKTEVVKATLNDIKTGSDAPKEDNKIKVGSDTYNVTKTAAATDVVVDYNYGATRTTAGTAKSAKALKDIFEGLKQAQNGDAVKFVCNEDGEITNAYVVNTSFSYVTSVNGDKLTIAGVGTIKISDNEVYEAPAKNDIVTYTKFYSTDKDEAFYTVAKAEAVEGELTAYKLDKGAYVNLSLDGTTYKTYCKSLASANIGNDNTETSFVGDDIGEKFTAYMVNGYVGYVIQNSDSANKVAVVIEVDGGGTFASNLNAPKVRLLLADGNKVNAEVDKDSIIYKESGSTHFKNDGDLLTTGSLTTNSALEAGQLVRYSVTSSGSYKLVEMTGTEDHGYKQAYGTADGSTNVYDKDLKAFNGVVTSGDCLVFAKQTDAVSGAVEWKVYTIRELNDIKPANSTNFGSIVKDGKAIAGYVELAARPSGAPGSTVYGIVSSYNGTTKVGGDTYRTWTVENDEHAGEDAYTVMVDDTKTVAFGVGDLVYFDPTSDNVYGDTAVKVLDGSAYDYAHGLATWVKEYNEGDKTITVWGSVTQNGDKSWTGADSTTYALDDKCAIVYVDVDNGEGGDNVGIAEFDSTTGYKNVLLVKDANNAKVIAILVESSRDADIIGTAIQQDLKVADAADGVTAQDLKDAAPGVYIPTATKAGDMVEGLTASSVRLFRFDTKSTGDYTISIKNSAGTEVFNGKVTGLPANGPAFAFIGVKPVACQASDTVNSPWNVGTNAPAGMYTFTITSDADSNAVVLSGIFSV